MINVVRIILLIIALGVLSLAAFYFYKVQNNKVETGKIKAKLMGKGVDLEIENFKMTHEEKGTKEWILNAVLAQVNNQENVTNLKGIKMIIPKGQNQHGGRQHPLEAISRRRDRLHAGNPEDALR